MGDSETMSLTPRAVSGVILAAGASRRFGTESPKQLVPIAGEPLIRRIVRRAISSRLREVIVVVGFAAPAVAEAIEDLSVSVVENPEYATGQASSVRVGLTAVAATADAAMFTPVDQPLLSASVIDALIACYTRTGGAIVLPKHGARRGAPVLFDRSLFGELAVIQGDAGGRQLFDKHPGEIIELPLASPDPLEDLDSFADLRRFGA